MNQLLNASYSPLPNLNIQNEGDLMNRLLTFLSAKPTLRIQPVKQEKSLWRKNCARGSRTQRGLGNNDIQKFVLQHFSVALVLCSCLSVGDSVLGSVVVLPKGMSTRAGNNNDDGPLGAGILQRAQYVFGSSQLDSIQPGDQIIGLTYRVDEDFIEGPLSAQSISNYEIWLSTSANPLDSLDAEFANNLGADAVLVKSGELMISDGDFPTGDTVNEFGAIIPFDVPFTFMSEPLLIDITHDGFPEGGHWVDAHSAARSGFVALFGRGFQAEFSEVSFDFAPIFQLEIMPLEIVERPCDLNDDGACDGSDIDALSSVVREGMVDPRFDLNSDGMVDDEDRLVWVHDLENTWFGDANLDGEFNSTDLVLVFQPGEYEDDVIGNSGWATGDWNGDAEFDSADFVNAFQDGGYELGPRTDVNAVPEPTSFVLLAAGAIGIAIRRRYRQSQLPVGSP